MLGWLSLVLNIVPTIIAAIKHVKDTDTTADPGTVQQKVADIVTTSVSTLGTVDPAILAHPAVQTGIGDIVTAVTALGATLDTLHGAAAASNTALPPVATATLPVTAATMKAAVASVHDQ